MTTTCALCGLVYEPGRGECRARGCPLSVGCRTRHCPRCGYTVPDEEGSVLARWVRRMLGGTAAAPPRTLAELPAGGDAVVAALEGDPALLLRLTAQGLSPGVPVHLVQRVPAYVVEVGETTLALERQVAETIRLR
jgi:Fe2+ transport system protein FeoA